MSIPHLDLSALTQVTPSINATVASAADAVAPDSSASQSPFETNLPFINPCVPTEKKTNNTVEVASNETCFITQKTTLPESTGKAEQIDTKKMLVSRICFHVSVSHASTLGSPTAHLNNEKMHITHNTGVKPFSLSLFNFLPQVGVVVFLQERFQMYQK